MKNNEMKKANDIKAESQEINDMRKMLVYEGAGVNADTLRIVIQDNDVNVFDEKYYCGYDYSWSESFATPEKPLKRNLIQQIADRFGMKDIEYLEGERLGF